MTPKVEHCALPETSLHLVGKISPVASVCTLWCPILVFATSYDRDFLGLRATGHPGIVLDLTPGTGGGADWESRPAGAPLMAAEETELATLARSRILAVGILLLMLVPALSACGSSSTSGGTTSAKKIKIGLVTDTGGLNDKGFNALAYTGEQNAVQQLGVVGDVKESKSSSDYVPNLTGFASQGYDLVIAVGFLMETDLGTVAQQFPNVHFAIIDGDATDSKGNVLNLN